MIKNPRKNLFLILLLIIPTVINIAQFNTIRNDSFERWTAIPSNNDEVIFDNALRDKKNNFTHTHNIYIELGKVNDKAVLILPHGHPFGRGGELLAIGDIEYLKTYDYNPAELLKNLDLNETKGIKKGVFWESLGTLKSGDAGISWEIYAKDNKTKEMIFIEAIADKEWIFIDKRLINAKVISEFKL